MQKIFTLAAAGVLAIGALSTQAQTIAVDGVLNATEISASGYQLVGRYTQNHGFGDAGLLSLYAAGNATNVYFFLAGTLETDQAAATQGQVRNSLQLYLSRPGVAGIPVGTALPMPVASTPITSFLLVGAKLDLPGDFGIGVKGTGTTGQVQVDGVVYSPGATPTAVSKPLATGLNVTTGAPATIGTAQAAGAYALFANAVVAFKNSSRLSTNPGFTAGGATSTGLEVSLSRASLGIAAAGGPLQVFGVQNNADGDYFSSDIIPQNTGPAPGADPGNGNLQRSPDFTAIPGRQAATLQLSATGGSVLASKTASAARVFSVFPNPTVGGAPLYIQLVAASNSATYTVRNMLGQVLRSGSFEGTRVAISTTGLPPGTYLLTVESAKQDPATSRVQVY